MILLGRGAVELGFQIVEEERVDDLVDVLGAGVVHAAGPARVMAEGAFEYGTEHGWVNARPVEFLAAVHQDLVMNVVVQLRHLDALAEQAAVHVGEAREDFARVLGLPRVVVGVEPLEELQQGAAQVRAVHGRHVLAEEPRLYQPGVLAKHQEHQAGAEHGERVVALLTVRVVVELGDLVVDLAHDAAGLDGDGALDAARGLPRPLEELEGGEVLRQVIQGQL